MPLSLSYTTPNLPPPSLSASIAIIWHTWSTPTFLIWGTCSYLGRLTLIRSSSLMALNLLSTYNCSKMRRRKLWIAPWTDKSLALADTSTLTLERKWKTNTGCPGQVSHKKSYHYFGNYKPPNFRNNQQICHSFYLICNVKDKPMLIHGLMILIIKQ